MAFNRLTSFTATLSTLNLTSNALTSSTLLRGSPNSSGVVWFWADVISTIVITH